MAIRWVTVGRVSYQRVGVLATVCSLAPEKQSTSAEALSRAVFAALAEQRVPIAPSRAPDVATYLDRLQLSKRYGELQRLSVEELVGRELEAQDYWLADSRLRASATGAITRDVLSEPVQLAIDLGLVRPGSCTLVDRGKALRTATSASTERLTTASTEVNPFALSTGAALVAAYVLLDADYDFMRAAYSVAADGLLDRTFTRREFALRLDEACLRLRDQYMKRARSRKDELALRRLAELAESIRDAPSATTRGGARPPDKTATLRTEPYVDIGLLSRVNRFDYRYELTTGQRTFFSALADEHDADVFLNEMLAGLYVGATGTESRRASDAEIWDSIVAAYPQMRSSLGYASFTELALVAAANLLDRSSAAHFEIADGVRVLKERQKLEPTRVKFGVKRGGGLRYVKLGRGKDD